MSYLYALSYCSWGSQGKNVEVVCHSLLQWTTFTELSIMTHPSWLALYDMDHGFIESDKACDPCDQMLQDGEVEGHAIIFWRTLKDSEDVLLPLQSRRTCKNSKIQLAAEPPSTGKC